MTVGALGRLVGLMGAPCLGPLKPLSRHGGPLGPICGLLGPTGPDGLVVSGSHVCPHGDQKRRRFVIKD